ncbi:hypothetical protein B0H10DRAFT_2447103 [Mycena sp. CBHHK59/15]|nr:hypothetical protein B0H10DRAFT_2447103 [Mycena sp. CBHHK59/15]
MNIVQSPETRPGPSNQKVPKVPQRRTKRTNPDNADFEPEQPGDNDCASPAVAIQKSSNQGKGKAAPPSERVGDQKGQQEPQTEPAQTSTKVSASKQPAKKKSATRTPPAEDILEDVQYFTALRGAMRLEQPLPAGSLERAQVYLQGYGHFIQCQAILARHATEGRRLDLDKRRLDIDKWRLDLEERRLEVEERTANTQIALQERDLNLRERELEIKEITLNQVQDREMARV